MFSKLVQYLGRVADDMRTIEARREFGLFSIGISRVVGGAMLFVPLLLVVSPGLLFLWLGNEFPDYRDSYTNYFFVYMFLILGLIIVAIVFLVIKAAKGQSYAGSRPKNRSYRRNGPKRF